MKLAVKSLANKGAGEVEVPDAVFAYPYKEHLIHLAVVAYRAAQRSGSHKTKSRGEIRGSTRKLYRQKGTGRARAGSARSPLRRGGATIHGPKPRDYSKDLSVGEKKNALKSALSRKVKDEQLIVVENLALDSMKTRDLLGTLGTLGVEGEKALLVDDWGNNNLGLAARNLPHVKAVDALGVNVYDVVDNTYLLISQEALGRLVGVLDR